MQSQFQKDLADAQAQLALIPEQIVREAQRLIRKKGNRYAGSLVLAIIQLQRMQQLEIEIQKQSLEKQLVDASCKMTATSGTWPLLVIRCSH